MASTTSLCSSMLNVVPARDLSFSAAFASGSPLSCCRPMAPKSYSKLFTSKCSLSEQDQAASSSVGRRALAGMVATGAVLAVFTNMAIAAQGPGSDGPQRTAEKADQLLKAADKLNIEDAPKRFGPGQLGGAQDPTKISQQAGSGPLSSAQAGIGNAAKGVNDAAKKAKNKSGGFFGFGKNQSGAVADNNAKGALSQAKGMKTDDVVSTVRQAVNRDGFGRFRGPTAKDIAFNAEEAVGKAQNKKSQLTNSAKDAIGQAQSKSNIGNSGGNVLSSLQEGLQGLKESVTQTGEGAKNKIEKSLQ